MRRAAGGGARHGRAARAQRRGLDVALRAPRQHHAVAVWLWRLGQARMDHPRPGRRKCRLPVRGQFQPLLGRAPGQADWPARPVGQDVRQQPYRFVQRPGHDRAGQRGEADDCSRAADSGRGVCINRRHVGRAGRVRGRGRHSHHRFSAARQGQRGAVDPADRQRCAGAGAGY